ncbi:MAG: PaaI family thioesterase [Boseongicola sp.]
MSEDRKQRLACQFIESIPHARALGMEFVEIGLGEAELTMPYDERLVGDPSTGVIHGGAISTLMDTCSGAAVMSHPANLGSTATIDFRIDYMRSATPGQKISARATCYHITRTVAFVRAVAMDEDRDNPVATATGAFTVERGVAAK